jgi:ribonuclease Z
MPMFGRVRRLVHSDDKFTLRCARLKHRIDTFGWRLDEPDGRRILPERLSAFGIAGADIGRLQAAGQLEAGGRTVSVEEVSEHRPGQSFAFVMDTAWCDAASRDTICRAPRWFRRSSAAQR